MHVVIAGGHGKIALRLEKLLSSRGDTVAGLVRNPDHEPDLRAVGAEPVLCDLEECDVDAVAEKLRDADAVVFAAGAGPGSGAPRKDTVDRAAAALLADAAEQVGIRRYLIVSSIGAGKPPPADANEVFAAYLRAKAAADDNLARRDLDWTILRPGGLTDDPGTGQVWLAPEVERGNVPRDDVAAVLLAMLDEPRTAGAVVELVSGDTSVADAVAAVASG